jgi:hypothetical protein
VTDYIEQENGEQQVRFSGRWVHCWVSWPPIGGSVGPLRDLPLRYSKPSRIDCQNHHSVVHRYASLSDEHRIYVLLQKHHGMSTTLDTHHHVPKVPLRKAYELNKHSYRSLHCCLGRRRSGKLGRDQCHGARYPSHQRQCCDTVRCDKGLTALHESPENIELFY